MGAASVELPVRSHPPDIRKRALAKLQQLDAAMSLEDLRVPPSNRLEALAEIAMDNTASASTSSGGSASYSAKTAPRMWRFRSITSEEEGNR